MLEVRLLGRFDIQYKMKPVLISSRPAQSLFAYLILNAGTSHRREKLAGLLWPDSLEETARDNLRHALWRMRKALEAGSAASFLQADDVAISFQESSDYWLDAAELENVSENASADELIGILSNYRGELLPGFYEEWVMFQREHLHSIFERHMERLLALLEKEKRWLEVLDWGERWIKLGEKPEPAYRALISAHAAKGDMSKVAATYERCVKALKEFRIEPSKQTKELFERLKTGQEDLESRSKLTPWEKPQELANTNLPVPLTSFVGREREMEEVKQLLSTTRLLTLTGTGGIGKTRLAIQTANDSIHKFKDSVYWVSLVGISDESLIPQEIAHSLNLREASDQPLIDTLKTHLQSKDVLLVMDNCEHLIRACAHSAEQLLAACPKLTILATSRERLAIPNETAWHVPSLSENTRHQLFVERARAAQHDFVVTPADEPFITQICERLDGIPLAIELAAVRVSLLSVKEIAQRLDDRFSLLTKGSRTVLARQQTLRATIDWSYDLLNEQERTLFQRLCIFSGGFTLEASEAVCSDGELKRSEILELLGRLVDKSLVEVAATSNNGRTRYNMLETLREYGWDKLRELDEERLLRDRHMEFFTRLAIEAELRLRGPETLQWVNRLEAEHDNLLAAIEWSLQNKNADFALQTVGALMQWDAWHNKEGAERSLQVVRSPLTNQRTWMRAKALNTAAMMQWFQGNVLEARTLLEEAMTIGKAPGHEDVYIWTLSQLGNVLRAAGDYATAHAYLEEAIAEARRLGAVGEEVMGYSLSFLGDFFIFQGDREQARQSYEESVARLRELDIRNFLPYPLRRLAELELDRAEYEKATALCKESLSRNIEGRDQRAIIASLAGFAAIAAARGHVLSATRLYGAVEVLLETISATLLPLDQQACNRNVAMIRSQLDEATFHAMWTEGRTMTLETAIDFALLDAKE